MSSTYRDLVAGDDSGWTPPAQVAARRRPAAGSRADAESGRHQVFLYVLLLYLFMFVSRLPELVPWFRVGLLLIPIMLVGLVLTQKVRILLDVRSGRWLIGFTIWVLICVPLSFWPGDSLKTFITTAQSLAMVAFILAFVRSLRDVMRVVITIGLASSLIAILSFISSANIGNRQGVGGSATVADPNYFALYVLVGTAMLCLTASQKTGWGRWCAVALIAVNLSAVARSGSRAGLIALAAGLILFLVYASAKQRTVVLSVSLAGILVAAVTLPGEIKDRFTDLFISGGLHSLTTGQRTQQGTSTSELSTAESSTEGRMYLLRRSLILTAKHPLFGVGPNQFQVAEAADATAAGALRGAWNATHNVYTQMSSELGIPGMILYVGALLGGYRGLSVIRKRGKTRHIRQMALYLQTTYFMLLVGAFFLSLGYGGLLFVMIGLSDAFKRSVARQSRESNFLRLRPDASAVA